LWRFEIGGNIEQLNKYIYFAELAKPIQIDRQLFVQTAFISKKIKLGKWHTTNQIIWQKSTNEDIINIPEFVFFHSSYVELQFKKILTLHLGIDLNYTTSYKAMNYNPSVGQFFYENNNTIKTGNYPIGSIFANALIKESVLLFIKFEHVNSGLVQDLYYTTNHYPINNRMFKVGVRWTFPN